MRDPAGPNPNYVGPPGNHHGMSTGGSNYKLKYAVPMCYVSDDNTDKKGLRLEMINIPHHAFSDALKLRLLRVVGGGADDEEGDIRLDRVALPIAEGGGEPRRLGPQEQDCSGLLDRRRACGAPRRWHTPSRRRRSSRSHW